MIHLNKIGKVSLKDNKNNVCILFLIYTDDRLEIDPKRKLKNIRLIRKLDMVILVLRMVKLKFR